MTHGIPPKGEKTWQEVDEEWVDAYREGAVHHVISYRIEWKVPASGSVTKESYWSAVTSETDVYNSNVAFDRLAQWRKDDPENEFRLIQVTETCIG